VFTSALFRSTFVLSSAIKHHAPDSSLNLKKRFQGSMCQGLKSCACCLAHATATAVERAEHAALQKRLSLTRGCARSRQVARRVAGNRQYRTARCRYASVTCDDRLHVFGRQAPFPGLPAGGLRRCPQPRPSTCSAVRTCLRRRGQAPQRSPHPSPPRVLKPATPPIKPTPVDRPTVAYRLPQQN
jgi:hypothetical protein